MWGCDCTVCIAGGGTHACLGTAPSGTGVRTYDCGACENLLTVLDMISTCERRADFCGGGVGSTAPPCVTSGGLSRSGSLRSPSALPAASGVLPRSLGCGAGVVCPEEDVSPAPLERGIQAWNTSLLFCCFSNLAAILTTASPKAPWTETGASRSGAFSLSDSLASDSHRDL